MSDDCKCDQCGARGRRARGKLAPADWLFLETVVEDEVVVTLACSQSCALKLWKKGPGELDLADESSARRLDATAEPAFKEVGYLEYGLVTMLMESLGVSATAVRETAISRARAALGEAG